MKDALNLDYTVKPKSFAQEMVKIEFYVFLALLSVSFILLIAAVSTDHWVEFGIDAKSYQGLWNLCYRFSRTKTTVCSGLDKISGTTIFLIYA